MKKTITYKEIKDKVLDIINNGGGGGGNNNVYSTEETAVGIWLGKTLYRKVIPYGYTVSSSPSNIEAELPTLTGIIDASFISLEQNCNVPVSIYLSSGTYKYHSLESLSTTNNYLVIDYIKD